MIAPNNSFNPNPLRSTNNMANRACHVVGSTTQVGLTQALARKDSYDSIGKSKSDIGGIGVGRQESTAAYLHPSIGIDSRASRRSRRSEELTSELQSLMRLSYAFFCLTTTLLQLV